MTAALSERQLDRQYYSLQYLRAIAALGVLVMHAFQLEHSPLRVLASGVDLFFVLSGFIMMAIASKDTRPADFLWARIRRIVPLYWLSTTAAILILWGDMDWANRILVGPSADIFKGIPTDLVLASYAFIPWPNAAAINGHPIVPLGWTVNLEMMFYLLVAGTLSLPRKWQFPVTFAMLVTLSLAGFRSFSAELPFSEWTRPIILEFAVGAWIGHVWRCRGNLWLAFVVSSGLIFAILCVARFTGQLELPIVRISLAIPFSAVLVLALLMEERPAFVQRLALPLFLGNASYAIYLVQFLPQLVMVKSGVPRGPVFACMMIASTLLLAAACHVFVERPLLRYLGRKQPVRTSG